MTIKEMEEYIIVHHNGTWSDIGTTMADTISVDYGGHSSSSIPAEYSVLKRASRGQYELIKL
ncbi:hypothetical protein [Rossellomorea aquimaris]|uniref:Uncharacterized protein n=1 Tax=Rossellomorea aquimaris TaxID=189382 RepID=A0A5D4TQA3_9BACI|nr:hypothetical protein [Rossellomorea aquimaris]TYS76592.1 hypothetical protein FZC80_14915 [Rossellomorea aquimaris]